MAKIPSYTYLQVVSKKSKCHLDYGSQHLAIFYLSLNYVLETREFMHAALYKQIRNPILLL